MFGNLKKYNNPWETEDQPELDKRKVFDDTGHKKYQILIGMLVWVVKIGRIEVAHVMSSLSRFTVCPRQFHLDRVLRVFGHLKK